MSHIGAIVTEDFESIQKFLEEVIPSSYDEKSSESSDAYINPVLGFGLKSDNPNNIFISETVKIVFDGFIYNSQTIYTLLDDQIDSYNSSNLHSKILFDAYSKWGFDLIKYLKGTYKFIIADEVKKCLFIASDNYGFKTIFHGNNGGNYYITSRLKGLNYSSHKFEENTSWRINFLKYGFLPTSTSTLKNFKGITKNTYLVFDLVSRTLDINENNEINNLDHNEEKSLFNRNVLSTYIQKVNQFQVNSCFFYFNGNKDDFKINFINELHHLNIPIISIDFSNGKSFFENSSLKINISKSEFLGCLSNINNISDQPSSNALLISLIFKKLKSIGIKIVYTCIGGECNQIDKSELINDFTNNQIESILFLNKDTINYEKNQVNSNNLFINNLKKDFEDQACNHDIKLIHFEILRDLSSNQDAPLHEKPLDITYNFSDTISSSCSLKKNFPSIWLDANDFKNLFISNSHCKQLFKLKKLNSSSLLSIIISLSYSSVNFNKIKINDEIDKKKLLFLYLAGFCKTGGIENVNKIFAKTLFDINSNNLEVWGIYDGLIDNRYIPQYLFKGFSSDRICFLKTFLLEKSFWNHVIVGHINLASAIYFYKILNPNVKITLITHGIEVWKRHRYFKKWILKNADQIITVSQFTSKKLVELNNVDYKKIKVIPNSLNPFFKIENYKKPNYLLKRYKIDNTAKIFLTITRLNGYEKSKGYDLVIESLSQIRSESNDLNFVYLLCGKYDTEEYNRIIQLVHSYDLNNNVILTGYLQQDELLDHYLLADIFIMPSKKEGFGIVFIEAAACGIPVIAGDSDGSVEALQNGKLGTIINPDSIPEIKKAILDNIESRNTSTEYLKNETFKIYNYNDYSHRVKSLINLN